MVVSVNSMEVLHIILDSIICLIKQVCLQWDEEEVCAALKDKQLLASILNDTSCLS
jgi:hypothetical protein